MTDCRRQLCAVMTTRRPRTIPKPVQRTTNVSTLSARAGHASHSPLTADLPCPEEQTEHTGPS